MSASHRPPQRSATTRLVTLVTLVVAITHPSPLYSTQLVFTDMVMSAASATGGGAASSAAYCGALMGLAALLAERLDDTSLAGAAPVLLQCAKKALVPYLSLLSAHATSSVDSDAGVVVRDGVYRLIDAIARKCPAAAAADTDLLVTLFRLLDCEGNSAVVQLYTCLGGLRDAYLLLAARDTSSGAAGSAGGGAGAGAPTALKDLIQRSRTAQEPKKRCAAVQWARALFDWSPLVLDTLVLLADDPHESVSKVRM